MIPPQGIGGGVVDADAVEDAYIAKFKALDPKAVRLLTSAESMVNAGFLTVDDVAKYIYANANIIPTSVLALYCNNIFSVSFSASLLGNANLPASIAKAILSNADLSANRAQSILYSMVDQSFYDKLVDIMTVDATNTSYTSNTTLSAGINIYRNLSIASGVTLTLGASPGVIIAYSVTNSGTIASGWVMGSGGGVFIGAGPGGGGRGAVIILASSIGTGTVTANGANGANGGVVPAYTRGGGGAGGAGNFWLISGDAVPNGGNGGGSYAGPRGSNGGGGGTGGSYQGGNGGSATTTTFSASSLLKQLFKAVCDWWLVNIVGKTPSSTISIPSLGGSGGGGGGAHDGNGAGGGGGGGGGQIIIYGTSVTAGTVRAKGGAGGNGGNSGYDYGAGGGGGGIIYVYYRSLTGTFTYDVSGGAGGTGDGNGYPGGTGVFRTIAV
jgi:hypothetical protein